MSSLSHPYDLSRPFKLLCIGNSFSDDASAYLPALLTSLGTTQVTVGNLYIAGCSLHTHLKCATEELGAYDYRKNTDGNWITTPETKLSAALADEDWDIITMQQGSGNSGLPETFASLPALISYVRERCPKARLLWHMTWAYQGNSDHGGFLAYGRDQERMYRAIVDCVKSEVLPCGVFDAVIPVGTAVQNARTSPLSDTLTRDGYHLTIPFGRHLAGLTFLGTVTGQPLSAVSYAPDGLTETEIEIAKSAATAALVSPFTVTPF